MVLVSGNGYELRQTKWLRSAPKHLDEHVDFSFRTNGFDIEVKYVFLGSCSGSIDKILILIGH